ncbi:MAG: hypothetical protein GOV00_02965, partial [Candidatus Altiarchaeota archaeon]|nr:hypothetical protein [Candidatus Altiarchaeota archaeon]
PDVKLIGSKILEVFEGDPSYKIVVKGFTKNKLLRIWVQGNKVIVQDEVGKKDEYEIGNKYHQYYFKSKVNEFVKQVEGPTNLVFKAPVSLPSVPQKVEAPVKGKVSKTVKEKLSTKIKFKLPKFIKKETIKSELGDTEEKVFATENEVKKMEGSADFLVQFTRRMMNEEDLDKRADRLRKSLSYGKHTYQKVLPSDLKRVAWAFASAMKELSVERQKELLELIVDGGLRDHILDKLQRVEDPETMLKESLHRVEETMGKMDTVHRKEISKTLREVEKKLDGRPVREVKKLTKPEVNVVEKQKEPAVELKKKLEKPEIKEKVVVKEKEPALVKEINLESELEMAQRMVREIVARRMATELNMEESEVLDHLGDGHWISAPLAALNKTVKFGVTKKTIDEEVERIVKWIDDNLYEGMVDEFQEEFQNQA